MSAADPLLPERSTTDRELVCALYRGLLGREPDPPGLAEHLSLLAARPGADAARLLPTLDVFLRSEEFSRRLAGADAAAPVPAGAAGRDAAGQEARDGSGGDEGGGGPPMVLGLGTHPAAAALLRRAGLGDTALPFDGLDCPLGVVRHALEDDFATLLDPAEHGAPPPGAPPAAGWHRFYEEELDAPDLFAAADPTDPVTLAALEAACADLRRALDAPRPRLFLVVAGEAQVGRGDFERLLGTLERRAAPPFRLLVLRVEEPGERQGVAPLAERDGHRLLALHPAGPLGPEGFALPEDELALRTQVEAARLGPWPVS